MSWLWVAIALLTLWAVRAAVNAWEADDIRLKQQGKYAKGPVAGTERTHGEGTVAREEWTKRQDRIRGRSQGWDREFPTE